MNTTYRRYQKGETIAAIATAPGEAAIAIVRISGTQAIPIAEEIFSGPVASYKSHTAHYGKILDQKGDPIDNVLLLIMRAPRSYTAEDTVEIFCHGGVMITRRVMERALQAGAKAAQPGEFTLKAFMNGKIDLAQAEAVQELISAKNDLAWRSAESQLEGRLSSLIASFQTKLTGIAAILEAWVDFPEEDLEFAPMHTVILDLQAIIREMQRLESSFEEGKILSEGLSLCLVGSPNVGKSSLMNALLGKERAIVSDIPGTTRDLLEENIIIAGLHFRLMDTAGIRETHEFVEKEGIRRSKEAMEKADLVLLVLDASRKLSDDDQLLLSSMPKEKTLLIWNKIDLSIPLEEIAHEYSASISAKEHLGLEALKERVSQMIWKKGVPSREEVFITKIRHKEALSKAIFSCLHVVQGLEKNVSAEFASSDMREALSQLSTIIGTNVSEDILSAIFSKFCIGK